MRTVTIKRWLRPLAKTPLHPQWIMRNSHDVSDFSQLTGRVLDIGCADGRIQHSLAQSAEYVGLDYFETAVEWYRTQPDIFGNAEKLPFPDSSFDGVIMLHTLEHIEKADAALDEIERVMRPGALGIIEVPFIYPIHDEPRDFRRWSQYGLPATIRHRGLLVESVSARGRASETAALMFALAVSRLTLDWINERSIWLALAPVLWLLIPIQNLIGFALAPLCKGNAYMPFSVRVVFRKPLSQVTDDSP